ncbi:MotA/TolQ/ExbB proton channel family protein [Herbaspirillum rubrisubalbicans]|uniref:MotA/TolQ/ExbB proton channel family protein n=1 Tax=Herbaspirillum rubrisubalbicans TaxID=80842 RepID=UPI00155945D5|nr:MotA/TolQ/ExbB proton channel family protein [Herbaspirillum rubrisubalbicans]NQE47330.1 biopolymer transporter [Herbaspirillum rubrisubalbicans]
MSNLEQLLELSRQSMGIIPILALLLLVVLAVSVERFIFFARCLPSGKRIDEALTQADHQNTAALQDIAQRYRSTIFGPTLQASVESRALASGEAMERYIDESIVRTMPELDRSLWLLGAAITLGPLIGLLGTIIGITESFNVLGTAGSSSGAVTNGIGHSLLATGCGLLVAIAGVAANSYFAKRVRLALLELDLIKLVFIKQHCLHEESISVRHTADVQGAGQGKGVIKRVADVVYAGAAS